MIDINDDKSNVSIIQRLLREEFENLRFKEDYGTRREVEMSKAKIKELENRLEEIDM